MIKILAIVLASACVLTVEQNCYSQQVNNCYYEFGRSCAPRNDKKPCVDQKCDFDYSETVGVDMNGDGTPDQFIKIDHYKCVGKIGYYANSGSIYYETAVAAVGSRNDLYLQRLQPETIYCWSKAGCPTKGCDEVTDVNNPQQTIWFCAEPLQTKVNDESAESTRTSVRVDTDFPCEKPAQSGSGGC